MSQGHSTRGTIAAAASTMSGLVDVSSSQRMEDDLTNRSVINGERNGERNTVLNNVLKSASNGVKN